MNENKATIAVNILRDILAQEKLLPASNRKISAFQMNHYVVPLKFNLEYYEALELMNSFQDRGFIEIVSHDLSISIPVEHENGKSSVLKPSFWNVGKKEKDENKKRISFIIKDIGKIKNFIGELEAEFEPVVASNSINRVVKKGKNNKTDNMIKKFPKLPAGTRWEFFTFIFTDSQNIKVNVGKYTETLNYKDLGLNSEKNDEPKISWTFFHILAQHNGELEPNSKDRNDSYKKAKQALSAILQEFFSIDFDPFYPYKSSSEKSGNSYKSKFIVCCENPNTQKEMEDEEKSFFEQCTESM